MSDKKVVLEFKTAKGSIIEVSEELLKQSQEWFNRMMAESGGYDEIENDGDDFVRDSMERDSDGRQSMDRSADDLDRRSIDRKRKAPDDSYIPSTPVAPTPSPIILTPEQRERIRRNREAAFAKRKSLQGMNAVNFSTAGDADSTPRK